MTTFGISLAASSREPIMRIAQLVARAEVHGFDYAYILDSQMAMKDVYVTMTLCASATSAIKLGQGVTNPVTRDLTVTASATTAIDEVSGGRAVLGIGNGATAVEGIGLKGVSLAATEDAVCKLRALLAGEDVEYNGTTIHMYPADRRIPIFLSASRPRMLELAGRVADGVILMGSSHPRLLEEQIGHVMRGLQASGRRREGFVIDLWQTVSVRDERDRAIEDVKAWVASQMRYWFNRTDELPPELERLIDRRQVAEVSDIYEINKHLSLQAEHRAYVTPELADFMTIAGDLDHAAGKLAELQALDVDNITMSLLSGGREARVETFGDLLQVVG